MFLVEQQLGKMLTLQQVVIVPYQSTATTMLNNSFD